jgi:hypothetical protein
MQCLPCPRARPRVTASVDGVAYGAYASPYTPSRVLPPSQQEGYIATPALVRHYQGDSGLQLLGGRMGQNPGWYLPPIPGAAPPGSESGGSQYWTVTRPSQANAGVQRVGGVSPLRGAGSQYATAQATTASNTANGAYAALLQKWSR